MIKTYLKKMFTMVTIHSRQSKHFCRKLFYVFFPPQLRSFCSCGPYSFSRFGLVRWTVADVVTPHRPPDRTVHRTKTKSDQTETGPNRSFQFIYTRVWAKCPKMALPRITCPYITPQSLGKMAERRLWAGQRNRHGTKCQRQWCHDGD